STLVNPACLPVVAADHERTPVATVHSCLRPTPHQLEVERLRPLGTPDHTRLPSACLHRDREPSAVARLLHTTVLELREDVRAAARGVDFDDRLESVLRGERRDLHVALNPGPPAHGEPHEHLPALIGLGDLR